MLGFELDLGAFARSAEAARERVEQRMREAIGAAGDDIAHASRADHPYTDRTGDLTRRTRAYAPRGSFLRDTLVVEIVAAVPYASFVNEMTRFRYLEPAAARVWYRVEHRLERALSSAAESL